MEERVMTTYGLSEETGATLSALMPFPALALQCTEYAATKEAFGVPSHNQPADKTFNGHGWSILRAKHLKAPPDSDWQLYARAPTPPGMKKATSTCESIGDSLPRIQR